MHVHKHIYICVFVCQCQLVINAMKKINLIKELWVGKGILYAVVKDEVTFKQKCEWNEGARYLEVEHSEGKSASTNFSKSEVCSAFLINSKSPIWLTANMESESKEPAGYECYWWLQKGSLFWLFLNGEWQWRQKGGTFTFALLFMFFDDDALLLPC